MKRYQYNTRNQDLNLAKPKYEILTGCKTHCLLFKIQRHLLLGGVNAASEWHSYSKIPSSSQPWMNVMDNFSESHVLAACDCFSILLAAATQSGPPAARRLPPTQTRLTLFMGRRIFYHRLRDRCGGRLGGSKLNLLWVVGPGYCFGLTPAHISGPRLLPDYLQVAIVLHRLRA